MNSPIRPADSDPDSARLQVGPWRLVLDAWVPRKNVWLLVHEDGLELLLTRAEHVVVQCLFEALEAGVPQEVLVQKVLQTWTAPAHRPLRATASIANVVGRLRARGRRLGLKIPIQCVATRYCWGREPAVS